MAKLVNEVSWSASRVSKLASCPRAYWFSYYCAWGGWERSADPRKRRAYVLKKILGLQQWAGNIVHAVIAAAMDRFRRGLPVGTSEELQTSARSALNAGWMCSLERWRPERPKEGTRLMCHERGEKVSDDERGALREHVFSCLKVWRTHEQVAWLLSTPELHIRTPEMLWSVRHKPTGALVYAAPDLIVSEPDAEPVAYDWKTGRERESDLLQARAYAWALGEEGEVGGTARLIYLKTGIAPDPVLADEGGSLSDRITEDVERMRALLNEDGETVEEAACPPEPGRLCRWCSFLELCEEGQEAVAENA